MRVHRLYYLICLTLLLTPIKYAFADQFVSIEDLYSSIDASYIWNQKYTLQDRSVDVNIPIIIPNVTAIPVLKVEPWMPDLSEQICNGMVVENGWHGYLRKFLDIGLNNLTGGSEKNDSLPALCIPDDSTEITEQSILLLQNDPDTLRNAVKGNRNAGYSNLIMYPWEYGDPELVYAEDNPYSMYEAVSYLEEILSHYYRRDITSQVVLDYIEVRGRLREKDKKSGELGKYFEAYPYGTYNIHYFQNIQGIPLMLSSFYMYDYYKVIDSKLDTDGFSSISDFQNTAEIMKSGSIIMQNCFVTVIDTLEKDIPLIPIEKILREIEEEIESGHVRNVYSLRLGYVCFLDEESPRSFVLYPMWVLECDYALSSNERIKDNTYSNDFRDGYGFAKLCINPQSGKVVSRGECSPESFECPAVIKWSDIDGDGY